MLDKAKVLAEKYSELTDQLPVALPAARVIPKAALTRERLRAALRDAVLVSPDRPGATA